MKKLVLAGVLVAMTSTFALAEWLVDFRDNYSSKGIDIAVEEAMKEGAGPEGIISIVESDVYFKDLNPQNLVKALYCAGASGNDIRSAAEQYNISDQIVVAGYNKSVAECGDKVADTQAYTPVATPGPAFSGLPSASSSGAFASESTF